MTNIKMTENFAPVRDAILNAVAEFKARQEQIAAQVQSETTKVRTAAIEGLDTVVKTHRANVDASAKATKAAVDGLNKLGELTQAHVNGLFAERVAGLEKLMAAGSIADAVALQLELIKSEQDRQVALAEQLGALAQAMAGDVMKPIQSQVQANVKALNTSRVA